MFTLFRLDAILVIIVVAMTLKSCFGNHRKEGSHLLYLLLGIVLFGLPLTMNWFGITETLFSTLNGLGLGGYWALIPESYRTLSLSPLHVYLIILLLITIWYWLCRLVALIFGSKERRNYHKNPTYVTHHLPLLGLIFGLIKSLIIVYLVLLFVRLSLPLTEYNVTQDLLYPHFLNWDVVVAQLEQVVALLPFPLIGG